MERRAGAEGNADQHSTHLTQIRVRVTQALDRVRQAARARKKERFTALLHHINPDTLEAAFYALKRKAAPGVDGVTWETVATVARTGAWTTTDVDLGAFAGHVAYVRFVFDGVAPGIGAMPDVWRIRDVVVHSGDLKRGG